MTKEKNKVTGIEYHLYKINVSNSNRISCFTQLLYGFIQIKINSIFIQCKMHLKEINEKILISK